MGLVRLAARNLHVWEARMTAHATWRLLLWMLMSLLKHRLRMHTLELGLLLCLSLLLLLLLLLDE